MWMKVRGGRGREALYICCVYMPTDISSVSVIDESYASLKEDILGLKQKGRVVLLGDFNARVSRELCQFEGEGGAPERGDPPEGGVGDAPDHSSSICRRLGRVAKFC